MDTIEKPGRSRGDIRLIAMAYFFATVISAAVVSAIGFELPQIATTAGRDESLVLALIGSLVLAAAVAPLAKGLQGSFLSRWLKLSIFTYVSFAVINVMEASVFSTFPDGPALLIFFAPPCLVVAGAAASLARPAKGTARPYNVFSDRHASAWWWRLAIAIVALPVIEGFIGLLTRPLLEDAFHQQQQLTLIMPAEALVMWTLLAKSVLLLAVTVPIICVWTRSRRQLVVALGLALFILTGLVGMVQASWWPAALRIGIATQVLLSSLAYSAVVVALLVPRSLEFQHPERSGA